MTNSNWIDIWKEIIEASQAAIRDGDDSKLKNWKQNFQKMPCFIWKKRFFGKFRKNMMKQKKNMKKRLS